MKKQRISEALRIPKRIATCLTRTISTVLVLYQYRRLDKKMPVSRNGRLAVVVHLFYTDNWDIFLNATKVLGAAKVDFDLFITMPKHNTYFQSTIASTFPGAYVYITPNQGRDVLPFVWISRHLHGLGYEYVLKLHSKKSTHRSDGQSWLESMVSSLVESREAVAHIESTLQRDSTGIIGPREYYYPLTINFPANGGHMTRVVKKLYGAELAHEYLQVHRKEYGFFGGTMFWARLDAIAPLLGVSLRHFEREAGQIDGTFAHALERLFCLIPEINGKDMFGISKDGVANKIAYKSTNIPSWSKDHDK